MPAARRLSSPQEQAAAEANLSLLRASLEDIDQELSLYDPLGPWRFFEQRLRKIEARAVEKLETGTLDEVVTQREVLKVVRDLLSRPDKLRAERALLTQGEDVQ